MTENEAEHQAPPITAHADPEGAAPWAMQMVVHAPKSSPPGHTFTLEAAAAATVQLLHHVEVNNDPGEVAAVQRWLQGRIRKVVRRARGASWDRAVEQAHTVTSVGDATVAAWLPAPTDQVPATLAKLQVSGLELTDDGHDLGTAFPDGRVAVYLNPAVTLSTGKAAAQVSHAAQLVFQSSTGQGREAWARAGAPVTVTTPTPQVWDDLLTRAQISITDAGFTEIAPGTRTCVAVHPFATLP